jgi:hypothetical protein
VVLHTLPDDRLSPVVAKLSQCDLPSLWKPRANQFFHIPELPYLGTDKIDLRTLKARVLELSRPPEAAMGSRSIGGPETTHFTV